MERNNSLRGSLTQQNSKNQNVIECCLRKTLDVDSFTKLHQVLEYLGSEGTVEPLFVTYNYQLQMRIKTLYETKESLPDGYPLEKHVGNTIMFFSFSFISNIGHWLVRKIKLGEEKAEHHFIVLAKILLYHALTARTDTANLALVELEQLALSRSLTLEQLYRDNRVKLLRTVIKAILQKLRKYDQNGSSENGSGDTSDTSFMSTRQSHTVIDYMTRALEVFNVQSITNDDVSESLIIIISLIPKEEYNNAIKMYLHLLVRSQNREISTSALLRHHIMPIVVNLLLRRKMSAFDMTSSLTKLCLFCDTSPEEILMKKLACIKGRILLHYSIDDKVVKDAIYYLSKFEKDESEQPFEDEFDDEKNLIDYLSPSMIGILLGIDSHFETTRRDLCSEKSLKEIQSLQILLTLLDKYQVQSIHVKLLSTLTKLISIRPIRNDINLNRAIRDLWQVFIAKLDDSIKLSLRFNICIALHDLLEDSPAEVSSIYEDLLCRNGIEAQQDDLKLFFFIPDIAPLAKVFSFLKPHIIGDDKFSNLQELEKPISVILPMMSNETQKCRKIAAARMRQLLTSNIQLITSNMLVSFDEPLDRSISDCFKALLTLASTSDCSALVGECLGLLGAINPTRLDHLILGELEVRGTPSVKGTKDGSFALDLVEKLSCSLFSDQNDESESANFALQVLIKTYNVLKDERITKRLSANAIKACQLCKDTNYGGYRTKPPEISTSVYEKSRSECHYSYKEWLDRFCLLIISSHDDSEVQKMLYACSYLFKFNQELAEYILQQLIVTVVMNKFSSLHIIKREMMSIVDEDVGVSTQDLDIVYSDDMIGSIQTLHLQCASMVFKIFESIERIDYETQCAKSASSVKVEIKNIREFIASIPKAKIAALAYKCRSYARALYYLEQHLFSFPSDLDQYATTLQRIYVALGDSYEASGIEMIRSSSAHIVDQSANREACGDFDGAFIGYTIALESSGSRYDFDRGSLIDDSLRSLSFQGDYDRLRERSNLLLQENQQFRRSILPYAIEASWKLSKWDDLASTLKREPLESVLESTTVCQGLLLKSTIENRKGIDETLKTVRERLVRPLSIAMIDQSAYFRGYQNLLALHSIGDFTLAINMLGEIQFETQQVDENNVESLRECLESFLERLYDIWDKRNKLVQPSLRSLEPLLEWQRSISLMLSEKYPFMEEKISLDVGKMWLTSADSATEAKSFRRSLICLTQAQRYLGRDINKQSLSIQVKYHLEQAKLEWAQGEPTRAIRGLRNSLNKMKDHPLYLHLQERRMHRSSLNHNDPFPDLKLDSPCRHCKRFDISDRQSLAELKMLLTQYCQDAAAEIPDVLFQMYEECVHLSVNQEETYLQLARYYDKLIAYYTENPRLCSAQPEDRITDASQKFSQNMMSGGYENVITKLMEHSIIAFGHSLRFGVRYVRESMPRMISIWYDLGSKKAKGPPAANSRLISSRIESSIRAIDELRNGGVPTYYFMTAISILLSRVCHPHSGLRKSTTDILENLLIKYTHQITWLLIALINDKENEERSKVARNIIYLARKKAPQVEQVVRDTGSFAQALKAICVSGTAYDKSNTKKKKLTAGIQQMKEISSAAANFRFNNIRVMVPTQASIRARLPMQFTQDRFEHEVFPKQSVNYVQAFDTNVRVFNSLQQPRMLSLLCENGHKVQIICKAGDDLRKDSRCLEFFDILNRILKRNRQSNERFIEIKTFLVLPLDSYTGIIEMVPKCESLRGIMEPLYKERKKTFNIQESLLRKTRMEPAEQYKHFIEVSLPSTRPPVLPTWFLRNFAEPTSWYMAKLAFTRSAAVTSMAGYIIGLGDRHLDNILVDTLTGNLVHVDFNLLFHQGEDLQVPERVPFRLSQNIIAAFGSLGTEGNFRKVSEITMRVMRKEKHAMLTTLIPFLHDPCSDWTKNRTQKYEDKDSEDKSARARIRIIEKKLNGYPRSKKFKPLVFIDSFSVEAQVEDLIREATDQFNLALMYYGWCAHL